MRTVFTGLAKISSILQEIQLLRLELLNLMSVTWKKIICPAQDSSCGALSR